MTICDKCQRDLPDGPPNFLERSSTHLPGPGGGERTYAIHLMEGDDDPGVDLCSSCLGAFISALLEGPDDA